MRNLVFERRTLFFQEKNIRLPGGEPAMVLRYPSSEGEGGGGNPLQEIWILDNSWHASQETCPTSLQKLENLPLLYIYIVFSPIA